MLAFDSADALTRDQHLELLRFLCDCVLDSDKMRNVLQRECGAGARGLSVGASGLSVHALRTPAACLCCADRPACLSAALYYTRPHVRSPLTTCRA